MESTHGVRIRRGIQPIRVLPLGFLVIILTGTLLLMLPAASRDGAPLPFLSALFTSTSASCVTGLVVVDTGTHFTSFGQTVILILIQLGGLGFMTMATFLFVFLGRRISLRERMVIAEGLGEHRLQGMVRLGLAAVFVTLAIEALGALALAVRFIPVYGFGRGVWYAVFHSVSAFCNAGFDLIGGGASFTASVGDPIVNLTLLLLIVSGGLGFSVLLELRERKRFSALRLHTKIVLAGSLLLILVGALAFFAIERQNPATLGALPPGEQLLASLFQSVTLRTAGFNTIDQAAMRDASKLISCVLMLIGGAPAGTAGGLKITTFAVMFLSVRAEILGRRDVETFGRRLSPEMIRRSLSLLTVGILILVLSVTAVSLLEQGTEAGAMGFLNLLYEAVSALCTVGVTTGVTAVAGTGTRLLMIAMMFIGRVGMLTLALALATGRKEAPVRYPEEEILIG